MANLDVAMILRLVDKATGPLKQVQGRLKGLGRTMGGLDRGELVAAAERRNAAYRGEAVAAGALAYSLYRSIRPAIEFESAMADVAKVVDFDDDEGIGKLSKDVLQLSKEIPIAADGLAAIVAAAGQANVVDAMLPDAEKRAELIAFTSDAARMSVAFDIAAGEAGAAMSGLRNIFGLTQPEVVSLGDAVNHLSNNMAAAAPEILNVLDRSGGMAKAAGLTAEQNAALAATFLALKTAPEEAGTSIKTMLTRLNAAEVMPKAFQQGLRAIGIEVPAFAKAIREDAQGALLDLLEAIEQADDQTAVRLRTVDGVRVALCAFETDPEPGDLYLDDADHYAIAAKYAMDWRGRYVDTCYPLDWAAMESQKKRDAVLDFPHDLVSSAGEEA